MGTACTPLKSVFVMACTAILASEYCLFNLIFFQEQTWHVRAISPCLDIITFSTCVISNFASVLEIISLWRRANTKRRSWQEHLQSALRQLMLQQSGQGLVEHISLRRSRVTLNRTKNLCLCETGKKDFSKKWQRNCLLFVCGGHTSKDGLCLCGQYVAL